MGVVSIVIPTYNRLSRLKQVLSAIEQQTYPLSKIEVVVVSDGSTDGTDEYLRQANTSLNLRFVPQQNAGPAAARNNGFRSASGEYILFIDDDVIPAPNLVAAHMELLAGHHDLVVLGPMINPPDFTFAPWVAWEQEMLEKQYAAMRRGDWPATARQFYTGNTSLARKILVDSGGFDERFRRAEDIELAYRIAKQGVTFTFTMNAVGYHYAERTFRSWLQIPYSYGRYEIIFSKEGQSHILDFVYEQFDRRNRLTRLAVTTCLDRPQLSGIVQTIAGRIADLSHPLGSYGRKISRIAYSTIFNVRYYQGIADELGGRRVFLDRTKIQPVGKSA